MAFLLPTLGATLGAAAVVLRRRYGYLPPLPRSLAFMVLATAALVFCTVTPAALGILSRPSVLIAAAIVLGAALLVPTRATEPGRDEGARPPASGGLSIVIAVVAVGAAVVYELARLRGLATQPPTEIDVLGFHLPGIARFIQSGTLWRVDQFEPGFATAQYPNNGDFVILAAVLPWRSLAFVRFVPLPYYAFTAVGTYGLALELRASRAAAATVAAAVATVPAMAGLALEGLPDVIALSTLAAGLVFLLRHGRSGARSDLVLAGLALGLSFGTKWYCTTAVTVVLVVWVAAQAAARTPLWRLAGQAATAVGMVLVGGGFWLLRNLIESGNPIYPKEVSLFGVQLFAGSKNDVIDQYGYTIADYLFKPHILRTYIYPGFKIEVGFTAAAILAGVAIAVIASAVALRRRAEPRSAAGATGSHRGAEPRSAAGATGSHRRPEPRSAPAAMLALALAAVGMAVLYTITPGSAYGAHDTPIQAYVNIRWLMPAVIVAAALTAAAAGAIGRAGLLLELAALAGTLDGVHLGAPVSGSDVTWALIVAAVLTAVVLAVHRTSRRRVLPRGRSFAVAAALAGCVAFVVLARVDQNSFDRHSYAGADPTFAWIDAHAPTGQRVGVTGVANIDGLSPVLPAFGPRLGNRVSYVGDPVRHSVHLPATARSFDTELRRGRYGLLMIGLQQPDHTDLWARAAGYRLVALSPRLALYADPRLLTR